MTKLNEEWLSIVKNYAVEKKYKKDELVYRAYEDANEVYVVLKGRIRAYTITNDGQEVTYEILGKGKIFGETSLLKSGKRSVYASAVVDTILLQISKKDIEELLLKYAEFGILFIKMIAESNVYLCDRLRMNKDYNRYQKVVYFLLDTTKEEAVDKEIHNGVLPYTHEDIANCVQLNRVTVSRVLDELEKKGYIRMKYKKIQVLKRKELEKEYL